MTDDPDETVPVELLPCPFCGEQPFTLGSGEGQRGLMIECATPGCVQPHVSYYEHEASIAAWNTRPAIDAATSTLLDEIKARVRGLKREQPVIFTIQDQTRVAHHNTAIDECLAAIASIKGRE